MARSETITSLSSIFLYIGNRINAAENKAVILVGIAGAMIGYQLNGVQAGTCWTPADFIIALLKNRPSIVLLAGSIFLGMLVLKPREILSDDWVTRLLFPGKRPVADAQEVHQSVVALAKELHDDEPDGPLVTGMLHSLNNLGQLHRTKLTWLTFQFILIVVASVFVLIETHKAFPGCVS